MVTESFHHGFKQGRLFVLIQPLHATYSITPYILCAHHTYVITIHHMTPIQLKVAEV